MLAAVKGGGKKREFTRQTGATPLEPQNRRLRLTFWHFFEPYFAFGSAATCTVASCRLEYADAELNFTVNSMRVPSLLTMPIKRSSVKRLKI